MRAKKKCPPSLTCCGELLLEHPGYFTINEKRKNLNLFVYTVSLYASMVYMYLYPHAVYMHARGTCIVEPCSVKESLFNFGGLGHLKVTVWDLTTGRGAQGVFTGGSG